MGTVPGRVGTITTSYFLDLLGETMALIAINKVTEERSPWGSFFLLKQKLLDFDFSNRKEFIKELKKAIRT